MNQEVTLEQMAKDHGKYCHYCEKDFMKGETKETDNNIFFFHHSCKKQWEKEEEEALKHQ